MAANGSGPQMATVRNLMMAWALTLPVAMMLSGGLYIFFLSIFGGRSAKSASGHELKSLPAGVLSAFPLEADISPRRNDDFFGPNPDVAW
jgi:hypothetical protein